MPARPGTAAHWRGRPGARASSHVRWRPHKALGVSGRRADTRTRSAPGPGHRSRWHKNLSGPGPRAVCKCRDCTQLADLKRGLLRAAPRLVLYSTRLSTLVPPALKLDPAWQKRLRAVAQLSSPVRGSGQALPSLSRFDLRRSTNLWHERSADWEKKLLNLINTTLLCFIQKC